MLTGELRGVNEGANKALFQVSMLKLVSRLGTRSCIKHSNVHFEHHGDKLWTCNSTPQWLSFNMWGTSTI